MHNCLWQVCTIVYDLQIGLSLENTIVYSQWAVKLTIVSEMQNSLGCTMFYTFYIVDILYNGLLCNIYIVYNGLLQCLVRGALKKIINKSLDFTWTRGRAGEGWESDPSWTILRSLFIFFCSKNHIRLENNFLRSLCKNKTKGQ